MSVVSSEVSIGNPITKQHVRDAAAQLGFRVKEEEVEALKVLLAAAHDTFEELSALPDYHLPVDRHRFPREGVFQPKKEENVFGFAWSIRCDIGMKLPPSKGADSEHAQSHPSLLLLGKNVVVKDNICVADIPQFNGTDATAPWSPPSDATVVSRILEAGGHIVGTATCEALSCATVSNTAAIGPVYNPFAEGYSAGGSSSGVAALVGSPHQTRQLDPEVHMGLGGDQGGSIRVPAAFCGIVGLKATHGLIPYTGVVNCEAVLDHVGPMCKTVMDTATLLEVIAGRDDLDDRQSGAHRHGEIAYSSNLKTWYQTARSEHGGRLLQGRRIAILKEAMEAPFMRDEMKQEIYGVAKQFEALGASIDEISFPGHETGQSLWMGICRQSLTSTALGGASGRRQYYLTGFLETLFPWNQAKWDRLPVAMRNEFINGQYEMAKYPHLYAKCMNLTLKLTREYESLLKTYDILLLPSTPFTAPPLFDRDTASSFEKISSTFGQTLNTMQFNLTGQPAITIPTGMRSDMSGKNSDLLLPVSVQLVGPLFGETKLLQFAYAFEQTVSWRTRINSNVDGSNIHVDCSTRQA